MLDAIRAFYRSLPGWAQYWTLRLSIALAAAFVSSVFMHIAVYAYALRHGARFPLEGVSFVALLGALTGFVFTLASMFLFFELPRALAEFHKIVVEDNIKRTHTLKSRLTANLVFVAGPLLLVLLVIFVSHGVPALVMREQIDIPSLVSSGVSSSVFYVLFGLPVILLAVNFPDPWSPWPRKIALWAFGIVVACVALAALLSPFDVFLRFIRFGGGLPVEIVSVTGKPTSESCLFLVSDGAVTVYDKHTDKFVEYRRDAVAEVRYSPRAPDCIVPTRQGNAVPVPSPDKPASYAVRSSPMLVCCGGNC